MIEGWSWTKLHNPIITNSLWVTTKNEVALKTQQEWTNPETIYQEQAWCVWVSISVWVCWPTGRKQIITFIYKAPFSDRWSQRVVHILESNKTARVMATRPARSQQEAAEAPRVLSASRNTKKIKHHGARTWDRIGQLSTPLWIMHLEKLLTYAMYESFSFNFLFYSDSPSSHVQFCVPLSHYSDFIQLCSPVFHISMVTCRVSLWSLLCRPSSCVFLPRVSRQIVLLLPCVMILSNKTDFEF